MDEEAVKKAVEEYLEAPDQYALMIIGEWGCGKTHFVEHALKDHVESLDKPYRLIRVSAYGTRTADDLYDAIALGDRQRVCGRIRRQECRRRTDA